MGNLTHTLGLAALLAAIWLLNSGHYEPLFFVFGAGSVALVSWISHRMDIVDHETTPLHLTPRLLPFYGWLLKQIVCANLEVLGRVWMRRSKLDPGLAWINTRQQSDMGKVIFANSITLTPGTVTIDIQGGRLLVHALDRAELESLQDGEMDQRVLELTP